LQSAIEKNDADLVENIIKCGADPNYLNEHEAKKEQVIEHYYNLSTIFSKSIKVLKENENPIKTLMQKVIDSLDHGKMKGHTNAVACILERDYEERFLQKLTENLKVETVKF
jgi:hypothetical protein